ncbi:MAG: phosphonate transport system substrate-binding protein [Sulfurimonas sp.]|jgi:phosphonate transport system substrate-binding protein|uniref:phosphate/phosphite/phosphonate ABC transporter substrate-binding protein n=1 Tax=Sulfurimonas sp. TaxID=2022749 RepID=UPI0039E568C7
MRLILYIFILMTSLNAQEIILGVVPQQSPVVLIQKWQPIADYLSQRLHKKVTFKTEMNIPKFEEELYAGNYDIAYMNPYHYVIAHEKESYQALARADKLIQGILLSQKLDKAFEAKQFKGKTFLFPAPKAFAATLLTKYELKKFFNFDVDKDAKVLYVNSHDSVYKCIARDVGDFGGGIIRTFKNLEDKKTKDKLSIVYKTSAYPSHPIAIHKRLTTQQKAEIQSALLSIPHDLLKSLNIKRLIKTDDSEYDVIRELAKGLNTQEEENE